MRPVIFLVAALTATLPGLGVAQELGEPDHDPARLETSVEAAADQDTPTHDDVANHDSAARHDTAGELAAADGDFVLAESELRASLSIRFRASTAWDHAFVLEQLGRYGEAVAIYDLLLELPDSELPPNETRASLDQLRRQASLQRATVRVVVHGAEDARIVLDGVTIGATVAEDPLVFPLDPGEHRLAARFGEREARSLFHVRPGEARGIALRFTPRPADVAAAATREPVQTTPEEELLREEQQRAGTRRSVVYWVLGGAVLIAGAVILGLALRPSSSEDDALPRWHALTAR